MDARLITDDDIVRALDDDDFVNTNEVFSDSENQDGLLADDVESDFHDEPSDTEETQVSPPLDIEEEQESSSSDVLPLSDNSSSASNYIIHLTQANIRGKNRHVWATNKGHTSYRTSAINIVRTTRGLARSVRNITDPFVLFGSFMTDEICEEIMQWTNAEIAIKKQSYETITSTRNETCKEELNALFGVLLLAAALKDNHLTSDELFNTSFCATRYMSCMSRERFDFLIRCLRFDDRAIRIGTLQSDPLTPIRQIWDLLMIQC